MIELENEQSAQSTEKDATQDAKLSDLQMSIDALNNAVAEIRAEISKTKTALENKTDSKLSEALETLRAEIGAVSNFIENGFTTAQVLSTHAAVGTLTVRDSLTAEEAEIKTATIADAEIDDALVEKLESGTVKAESIESDLMKAKNIDAEKISMDTLDIESLRAKKAASEEAEIEKLEAAAAKIARLNCQLVTVDEQGEWREPTATPTNTQLLKYDGIIQLVFEDKDIAISIIGNGLVTFSQNEELLYRVDFYDTKTELFFRNEGVTLRFKPMYIGSSAIADCSSCIVNRTDYQQNVSGKKGIATAFACGFDSSSAWRIVFVDKLPEEGMENVLYVIEGEASYCWDGTKYTEVARSSGTSVAELEDFKFDFVR